MHMVGGCNVVTPQGVAGFTGIGGSFQMEWVAALGVPRAGGHQRALNVQETGTVGQRRGFLRMARVAGLWGSLGRELRASVRQV